MNVIAKREPPGTIIYDEATSSYEFYGPSSTMSLVGLTDQAFTQLRTNGLGTIQPSKHQYSLGGERENCLQKGLICKNAPEQGIYNAGKAQNESSWPIPESVSRAHFEIFLNTVYDIFPLWTIPSLRDVFDKAWTESQLDSETPRSALVHSILALGALHSNFFPSDVDWADRHFKEAQTILGNILSLNCLETAQSAMLMVRHVTSDGDHSFPNLSIGSICPFYSPTGW